MSNTQKLTIDQIELLTRISNKDHYCCEWRNASGIDLWMDNLADLGLIQFVCDVKRLRFKLEITQAGLKALTK
jgi:hypothetical protein